ncbi:unnamed protein product [Symbiodinium sp. CCMP2456]|nr:unnamed protein product [Symbiodinium sp. CCMP2456]
MKEQGLLPDYVIHLIEDQAKQASSKRSFQTSAINRLFTRSGDGTLALNLDHGLFVEAQTIHTKHFSKGSQKALPQSVMKGLYFGNSQAAFEAAVNAGEVVEVTGEDGKTYWAYQSYEVGREDGKSTTQTLTKQQNKLKKGEMDILAEAFKGVNWKLSTKDQADMVNSEGVVSPAAQTLLQQGMNLIKKLTGIDDKKCHELKVACSKATLFTTQMQQVSDLHILPEGKELTKKGLQDFMLLIAKATADMNLLVETAKGIARANTRDMEAAENNPKIYEEVQKLSNVGCGVVFVTTRIVRIDIPQLQIDMDKMHRQERRGLRELLDNNGRCVPLALHGDGVPLTGVGKSWQNTITDFSFYSLLGEGKTPDLLMFVYCLFDKLRKMGRDSTATAHRFFEYKPGSEEAKKAGKPLADGWYGKAAEIKYLAAPFSAVWEHFKNPHLSLHADISLLLKLNKLIEDILIERKGEVSLGEDATRFEEALNAFLSLQSKVASCLQEASGENMMAITEKAHFLQHSAMLSKYLSPRLVWVFGGEDQQRRVQCLGKSAVKGNGPTKAVLKMVSKYRMALHFQFQTHDG